MPHGRLFARGVAIAACLAASAAAGQDLPGDPLAGREFALQACAPCHQVVADQESARFSVAPSFLDVANTVGMTPMALNVWLQRPHPTMPNLMLSPEETADVVSYIWGLRGEGWAQ